MRPARFGQARFNVRYPSAIGVCDICEDAYNLDSLRKQRQWRGNSLEETGFLVCRNCDDVPQDQYRSPLLPADPVPRSNPRVSAQITPIAPVGGPLPTNPTNQGFTVYQFGAVSIPGSYPTTKATALAAIAAASGVATPSTYLDLSATLTPAGVSVQIAMVNPIRYWLALYNPTQFSQQFAFGSTASWGGLGNLSIGPGEAFFWATSQGLGTVYQGAISAVGVYDSLPLWAFEAQGTITDDLGNSIGTS